MRQQGHEDGGGQLSPLEGRVLRWVLALVWFATAVVSLWLYPRAESLALLASTGLYGDWALLALYGGALCDAGFGAATLICPSRRLWQAQASLIIVYSLIISCYLPQFWLHPFGPLLKNFPILALLWLLARQRQSQPSAASTQKD